MQPRLAAAASAYRRSLATLSISQTVLLLLDGIVQRLQLAAEAYAKGRLDEEFALLQKATAIVTGLRRVIDFEHGGSAAVALDAYYRTLAFQLISLPNRRSEPNLAARLQEQVRHLREAWKEASDRASGNFRSADEMAGPKPAIQSRAPA